VKMLSLNKLDSEQRRALCETLWWAGVNSVKGERAVSAHLADSNAQPPDLTIAVGKAASSMCLGAFRHFDGAGQYLLATKHDHVDQAMRALGNVSIHECGHPIPDEQSLLAGREILDRVSALPAGSRMLVLVSGGASSLVEVLKSGVSLSELEALNTELVASGLSIEQINERRRELSMIKDGRLLDAFKGHTVDVLGISDVPQSDFATLGSGIGDVARLAASGKPVTCNATMIGSNQLCRAAVQIHAEAIALPVIENSECLYDDVHVLAEQRIECLKAGKSGIYVWGGEPTVVLPDSPGEGGRNQALGLLMARLIDGLDNMTIIVAGTDGTDGPTIAAGALVDGGSYTRAGDSAAADAALAQANAGAFLEQTGDRFISGPTGTNVMDLVIALKQD